MTTRDDFLHRMKTATEGTPYTVEPTDHGFHLELQLADAQWYGLFNKAGLTSAKIFVVKLHEDGRYSIEQRSKRFEWVAGVPKLAARYDSSRGRAIEFEKEKIWAFDKHGRFSNVVDYTFKSHEGMQLIRLVAEQLGLHERMPGAMKIGIAAAAVGASAVVVVPVALLGKSLGWWG